MSATSSFLSAQYSQQSIDEGMRPLPHGVQDAPGLLDASDDDIIIPIQVGTDDWSLGDTTPDQYARTPSLVDWPSPDSMDPAYRPVIYTVHRGQAVRTPARGESRELVGLGISVGSEPLIPRLPAGAFVPRLVPDPHDEIPAHFNEEQVRLCERILVDIRGACTERGLRGLGFANVPELALTMSTATLITAPTAPVRPPLERPLSKPWFSTIQEKQFKMSQLPVRMRMRLYVSDLGRAVKRVLGMQVEED